MSTIATKLTIEAAARLGTLIDAHARDAGRQLGEWLRPWLRDGESLPDFTLVLQLPARMIRQGGQRLRERLDALGEARGREGEARFQRDQAASALRRKLVEIRRLLTSALGSRRTATLLDVEGKTARDTQPTLLLAQAGAFLRLLGDPRRLGISHAGGYFDPAAAAADLEPLAAALREACGQLDETLRTCAARLEAKDRARTELGRAVRCVVRILGGWLLLIRRADLADKLSSIRRRGKGPRPG